jgi:hypothetical protein
LFFGAERFGTLRYIVPFFVSILCAEHRHIRISSSTGAKEKDLAFLPLSQKKKMKQLNFLVSFIFLIYLNCF